jgi:hypothetical protein
MSNWVIFLCIFVPYFWASMVFLLAFWLQKPLWLLTLRLLAAFFIGAISIIALWWVYRDHMDVINLLANRFPNVASAAFGIYLLLLMSAVAIAVKFLSDLRGLFVVAIVLFSAIGGYAMMYSIVGICGDSDCLKVENDWVSGLYFSVITFTTTGYGDYHPQPAYRLLAASEALAGYLFFGLFVSLFASYLSRRPGTKI